jgi:hypothetical protein
LAGTDSGEGALEQRGQRREKEACADHHEQPDASVAEELLGQAERRDDLGAGEDQKAETDHQAGHDRDRSGLRPPPRRRPLCCHDDLDLLHPYCLEAAAGRGAGRLTALVVVVFGAVAPATRMTGSTGRMHGEILPTIPATKPMMTSSITESSLPQTRHVRGYGTRTCD